MRRACCVICAVSAALALSACDKKPAGDEAAAPAAAKPAAEKPAAAKPAPAKPAEPAAGGDEKQRFIAAFVAAACAVQQAEDMTKMVDLTRQAYEKHGFNQLSYASARDKYANLPDVKKALEDGAKACAGAAAAKGGEGKPAIPAWATPPAGSEAAKAAEAAKEGGDAPAEAAKEAEDKPAKKGSAHAGAWAGTFSSGDAAGTLKLKVAADGKVTGHLSGRKPKAFALGFEGKIVGNKVSLNARKGGKDHASLSGEFTKGVVKGGWRGVISMKKQEGTWRATRK